MEWMRDCATKENDEGLLVLGCGEARGCKGRVGSGPL